MSEARKFAMGDLITNGSSAGRVLAYECDQRWRADGYRIQNVALEGFGGNVGFKSFVPDYLVGSWRALPTDWSPVVGGGLEERYVQTSNGRYRRELRRTGEQR